jgi:hypothetical protein
VAGRLATCREAGAFLAKAKDEKSARLCCANVIGIFRVPDTAVQYESEWSKIKGIASHTSSSDCRWSPSLIGYLGRIGAPLPTVIAETSAVNAHPNWPVLPEETGLRV